MKRFIPFLLAFFLLLPLVASAQFGPIVPEACHDCPCGFGGVMAIIQNLVNFIIGIAIIFGTIILVWGGILYIISPANPESRSTANKMLINAVVGLCIVLSAWLIVDFVMKTLYGGQFGPWNSILLGGEGAMCVESRETPPLFGGNITAVPGQSGIEIPSGDIQARICTAAQGYRGANTSAGPANGILACAWAVNNVLRNANVGTLDGDSVRSMEAAILAGRGTLITQQSGVCGDLVIVTGTRNHVGICLNAGCTQVISNSSSRQSFLWTSSPRFEPSYNVSNFKIYRVTN
ncbi:MAG TPA: pilin [Candidatus Paceibacterota bacterium]|nr:pilin [Candidatus Paceibacterota bacterium]